MRSTARRSTRRSTRRTALATALASAVVPVAVAVGASPAQAASFTKIEGAAAHAGGLTPTVDAFRALLGGPNNGSAVGWKPNGRREINWDGVPDNLATPAFMPRDLFNTAVPRGAVFANSNGNKFQVSADNSNPAGTPVLFANIKWQNMANFRTFSPQRLFTPIGTTVTKVRFFKPGTTTPATVNGFGAVFTDVDRTDSTKVELYDRWGNKLWGKNVVKGTAPSGSLSFLGVKTTADIYEVRITSGNTPIGPNATDGGWTDLVVMDDFLYGEPRPL
ncbi:hypothetical protein [Kineococcus glutinatus]|uniref:Uncharacterized protein n=1 Tax=Kineococcus glutinatus TaxID=1070872 RepID=A0ABP9HW22_9ACTN